MKDLKDISTRLEIAKKNITEKNNIKNKSSNATSLGKALKISTELVAAVFVGSIFGFILDNWFGTKPWLTITFFFIGAVAGILNVIRSAKKMHKIIKK
ncbi:AtpZ/AtpI family protein [Pelagibacteraceae bacterium]|nr:AtpZ/AtpI family protein [Pelagibacteraceae bacterium]